MEYFNFCIKCGVKNHLNLNKYCSNCGRSLAYQHSNYQSKIEIEESSVISIDNQESNFMIEEKKIEAESPYFLPLTKEPKHKETTLNKMLIYIGLVLIVFIIAGYLLDKYVD